MPKHVKVGKRTGNTVVIVLSAYVCFGNSDEVAEVDGLSST